jgi:DNA-binding response OmpR family regulator
MAHWRILLGDHDVDQAIELGRGLRAAGHTVIHHRDGVATAGEAEGQAPDVVIAAVGLPGLNGFQLCRRLKASDGTREIPVLLTTAKPDGREQFWADQVGAAELVHVPIDLDRLIDKIARARGEPGVPRRTTTRIAIIKAPPK